MAIVRKRSPRFPSHALKEAVNYASKIYESVHRSAIDAETAFKVMGFKGRSGASSTALGAVRQFGLIEGVGENTRISELALAVLEPESESEKAAALREAFRQPEVFSLVSERFSGRIPSLDEPIRAYLIRELGFSQAGAEQCLASLRDSLAYIETLPTPLAPSESVADGAVLSKSHSRALESKTDCNDALGERPAKADIVVHLGGGLIASVEIKGGTPTSKHLTKLGRFIALQAEFLAEDHPNAA